MSSPIQLIPAKRFCCSPKPCHAEAWQIHEAPGQTQDRDLSGATAPAEPNGQAVKRTTDHFLVDIEASLANSYSCESCGLLKKSSCPQPPKAQSAELSVTLTLYEQSPVRNMEFTASAVSTEALGIKHTPFSEPETVEVQLPDRDVVSTAEPKALRIMRSPYSPFHTFQAGGHPCFETEGRALQRVDGVGSFTSTVVETGPQRAAEVRCVHKLLLATQRQKPQNASQAPGLSL